MSPLEAIETCHYPMFNCAKVQSQWNQRLLFLIKKDNKSFKMHKQIKNSNF